MPDFGGGEFKTLDGSDVSRERPHGAMVVAYRVTDVGTDVLLLHRAGLDDCGDWAWTPPSGARFPGEDPTACAERELLEETGLVADLALVSAHDIEWALYAARVDQGVSVRLSEEHDRFEWTPPKRAAEMCLPAVVSEGLLSVLSAVTR